MAFPGLLGHREEFGLGNVSGQNEVARNPPKTKTLESQELKLSCA